VARKLIMLSLGFRQWVPWYLFESATNSVYMPLNESGSFEGSTTKHRAEPFDSRFYAILQYSLPVSFVTMHLTLPDGPRYSPKAVPRIFSWRGLYPKTIFFRGGGATKFQKCTQNFLYPFCHIFTSQTYILG
jgi:hypothetical protein